ncbi:DUF2177 family protein [Candidatus Saccharibacteria bacterium]|nr:MAG: DUF2177 family protein [Candidatus Saccharibacteria bacterium]
MKQWFLTYAAGLIVLLILDGLWLTIVAAKLYRSELDIIRKKPQLGSGILFYLLYSIGVTIFAILPMAHYFDGVAMSSDLLLRVFGWGAGLGIFAYATFTLTNQTVIEGWKSKLTVLDTLWGGILTGIVALAGFGVFRALA